MSITLEKINKTNGIPTNINDFNILDNNMDKIQNAFNNISTTTLQQSKTYAELSELIDSNTLIAGSQYILTDYKTKYKQPDTNVIKEASSIEKLVLIANSTNTFEIICSSLDYPKDIIYYDFTNNKCEDNITLRNGFIIRRIDTVNNINCTGDWRTMLWARYLPNATQYLIGSTLTNYSVWTSGSAQLGVIYKSGNTLYMAKNTNTPSNSEDSSVFYSIYDDITVGILRNDLKVGVSSWNDIKIKKSESYSEYSTFGNGCNNVSFTENILLHNNVFGNDCHDNIFGSNCSNNLFGNSCFFNTFKNNCHDNIFGSNCHSNTIENSCYNNIIGTFCAYNTLGNGCYNNIIGNGCYDNTIGNSCYNNVIGNYKKTLFIKYLHSKDLSSLSTLENNEYTITIEARSDNSCVFWSLNSSNVPVYTVIT